MTIRVRNYGEPEPPEGERLWTTEEALEEFEFQSFRAPMVRVVRRSDGVKGWMEFTHKPRYYFAFRPDDS